MLIDGYGSGEGDNVLRSSMEAGPGKARRRYTAVPKPVAGRIFVTDTQLGYFKTFYETTLLDGAYRFDWVDQDDGTTEVEMRFTSPPKWSPFSDDYWVVELELEIMP